MKFLADANISVDMVELVRALGHDCSLARELPPSMSDEEVLARAVEQSRIVLTTDKDFGELVFRDSLPVVGVLLIRVRRFEVEADRIARLLQFWDEVVTRLPSHFVTLSRDGVRSRPLE